MSDSLRDQLLKSGLVQKLKVEPSPAKPAARKPGPPSRPPQARQAGAPRPGAAQRPQDRPRSKGEPDLAQAYAQRARVEREERALAQREAERVAREKRERKQRIAQLLEGKALNATDADIPRHFPHGGKIRRIYCTSDQLAALNRGELAVVQQHGRYLLVSAEVATAVAGVAAEALVLHVDPNAPAEDDVPADLMW
jgi:uncharacterized protein YaiL (DUF2058 family)